MIVISWNCQGLANLHAIPALKDLVRCHRPDVIVLIETLSVARRVEEMRILLGFDFCFSVDHVGRSGDLAVLWRPRRTCLFPVTLRIVLTWRLLMTIWGCGG